MDSISSLKACACCCHNDGNALADDDDSVELKYDVRLLRSAESASRDLWEEAEFRSVKASLQKMASSHKDARCWSFGMLTFPSM